MPPTDADQRPHFYLGDPIRQILQTGSSPQRLEQRVFVLVIRDPEGIYLMVTKAMFASLHADRTMQTRLPLQRDD